MEFLLHIAAGASVGFAIGLTGVGGGSLMTPLLLVFGYPPPVAIGTDLLYAAITKAGGAFAAAILLTIYSQIPAVRVIGTDLAHAVPLTFIAGVGYLFAGYVDLLLLLGLIVGSLPAIHIGTRLSSQVSDRVLVQALTVILLILGVYYSFF